MRHSVRHGVLYVILASVLLLKGSTPHAGQNSGAVRPSAAPPAGLEATRLARVDQLIADAIRDQQLPGAVVLVGRGNQVLYQKAYGRRAVVPTAENMTLDTVFDLASLTKVVATTTSIMILIEEGRVRLTDRVASFIPSFGRYGKSNITVRHLLTHVSGLRPDLDLSAVFNSYDEAIARATEEVLVAPVGEQFIYSDINFFLLGDIVARVSGTSLDRFVRTRIFEPLGMRETMFTPPATLRPRIAPTEPCSPLGWPCDGPNQTMLRGIVHDPTARRMGGVAGHAGLFSTVADLSIFCRMLLGSGAIGPTRVLSPLSVVKMTTPATPAGLPAVRGLGWDIDSSYSSNRGELLPVGSFGHTGFTGTSLWLDPRTGLYIIFLSNRVHPNGKGDVTPLRAKVATVVASALLQPGSVDQLREFRWTGADFGAAGPVPRRAETVVSTGIDVLQAEGFQRLRGKRVGVVTNQVGRSKTGQSTIDLLSSAEGVKLVALFSPEHGIRGTMDAKVPSEVDVRTGLPVHSLYGQTLRPTPEMLLGLDAIVIDLQDIGARFYTYVSTMAYVMEAAAPRKIAIFVLDRPNPIDGFQIEGPTLDKTLLGFTGYFPMPIRHGLTIGELARVFNAENNIAADLTVVAIKGWQREQWFDETALPWVNPSPNMRNLVAASLYPGIGAIEASNISVGRGTDTPFEQIGAPWIDGARLARDLNGRELAGVRFYPVTFTPSSSVYTGMSCQGVFMIVTDRNALRPVRVGLEIAAALVRMYPNQYKLETSDRLFGSPSTLERLKTGENPARIAAAWATDEARWRLLTARYLLY